MYQYNVIDFKNKLLSIDKTEYKKTELPKEGRPYCIFDMDKVDVFVKNGEAALPKLSQMLKDAKTEEDIVEGLYIADRMIDSGVKSVDNLYSDVFSKFNESKSVNIQTFLAGIYRKTLNPKAFGPLVKMLFQNIIYAPKSNFDSNEEIGGAILEYLRNTFNKTKTNNKNDENKLKILENDNFLKQEKIFELPKDIAFKPVVLATKEKPYYQFDMDKVKLFVDAKEKAIPAIKKMLDNAKTEEEKTEGLFIANEMISAGTKGMDKLYYKTFSRFNEDNSPNIQLMLSEIYKKILVPDAFGPLIKMLITNILVPQNNAPFDLNESIGKAILAHIKAKEINPL